MSASIGTPVPLAAPGREAAELGDELAQAWERVLANARFILGPEVEAFETEFAAYCGSRFGIGVASGTDALTLAIYALDLRPGDEVITSALTSVATAIAILRAGAIVVPCDVDSKTLTLDPNQLEQLITQRTRAILPVHLYGQPAEMPALLEIANRARIPVVEDCAQAHGAEIHGRKVGSIGLMGCFSFYPTKNLGALGDGGMIVTDDQDLRDRLVMLRQYGWRERDRSESFGFNSRLDELQAAILRAKLPHLDRWNSRRREIASRYSEAFAHRDEGIRLSRGAGDVYHLFVLRTRQRDECRRLLASAGVTTGVHYPLPVHRHAGLNHLVHARGELRVSDEAADTVMSIPMFPQLEEAEIETVIEHVLRTLGSIEGGPEGAI